MNTTRIAQRTRRPEPFRPAFRINRAPERPAPAAGGAGHDFLIMNPRPDLIEPEPRRFQTYSIDLP